MNRSTSYQTAPCPGSTHPFIRISLLFVLGVLAGSCTEEETGLCGSDSAIQYEGNICLVIEEGALDAYRTDIEQVISLALLAIQETLPVDNLQIRVGTDPKLVIPEIGMGGYNPNAEEVILALNPSFSSLRQSIATELAPLLAHEVHHAIRRRTAGYGSSLLEAMISEGLADWYSIEIARETPPIWAVALSGEELDAWTETARQSWQEVPYDHALWFLGTGNIPRWTGYSIGFSLVKTYLKNNPNEKASTLVDEPADAFIP